MLEVAQPLLPGVGRQRSLTRNKGVAHQLLAAQHGLGFCEMVGQRSGVGLCVVAVKLFQSLSDPSVQPYPSGDGQLLGQCLLYQGVGELVAAHCIGQLLDYTGCQRLF